MSSRFTPTRRPTERLPAVAPPPDPATILPAPTQTLPALIVLTGPQQGAVVPLGRSNVFGRDQAAAFGFTDESISRSHARIEIGDDGITIEDLGSRNGTFLGDRRVRGIIALRENEHVRLGRSTLVKVRFMDELELRALASAYEAALRDPLTRVYNRRYFDDRLFSELSFARRHESALALLMVDLDHFKRVNDVYGHQAGDVVLRLVAATIQRLMRPEDVVARYGGEELVVIARGTTLRNAEILAERIRTRIEALELEWGGQTLRITASVGATASEPERPFDSAGEMISAADEALYRAKSAGRNRCAVQAAPSSSVAGGTSEGVAVAP